MRAFDPNKNPYADDLLRLAFAPSSRYRPNERRAMATIMAAKLYQVETHNYTPRWHPFLYHVATTDLSEIGIIVVFDSDEIQELRYAIHFFPRCDKLIVLSVGKRGVIEVFNGPTSDDNLKIISAAVARLREKGKLDGETKEGVIPTRSDNEVADDYQGKRGYDGASGGGGGDGGDGGDNGPGPDRIPGSGGARELLNHPVLFAVEPDIFDAIMEQV